MLPTTSQNTPNAARTSLQCKNRMLLTLLGYPNTAGTDDLKTILTLLGYPEHLQDIESFRISQHC